MRHLQFAISLFALLLSTTTQSCRKETPVTVETEKKVETKAVAETQAIPVAFSADSAYQYVCGQCEFGARVPNSEAHKKCAKYLKEKLSSFGAEVQMQTFTATAFDGNKLNATNIIGSFFPEKERRIVLFSHWDSRPFCDQDYKEFQKQPVMGANDGASGVGVLLEIARHFQGKAPNVGVDIVFLDAEDYGDPHGETADSWCLGSQYWAKHPTYHKKPAFGVLLDMVGGDQPYFGIDFTTAQYATDIATQTWRIANSLGYSSSFQYQTTSQLIDDHVYINEIAGIPTIDIIDFDTRRGFPATWHTHLDTPENISKQSLDMVGKTITTLIYKE